MDEIWSDGIKVSVCFCSEVEQTAAPETTTEGEENTPASSENKWEAVLFTAVGVYY